jgi:hypothetical protein
MRSLKATAAALTLAAGLIGWSTPASASSRVDSPAAVSTVVAAPANLCGAPANPYGYTFCGGPYLYHPASDICRYLRCISNFPHGTGYVEQCQDGTFSRSGGRPGSCSGHHGNRRPLYL